MFKFFSQSKARRSIALTLVLCAVISLLPSSVWAVPEGTENSNPVSQPEADTFYDSVKILSEGKELAQAELTPDEHLNLTAQYEGTDDARFTWQIFAPAMGQWVAIDGADGSELQVGYALLAGMLNEKSVALLNCKVQDGGALYYSNAVQIMVDIPPQDLAPAQPAMAAAYSEGTPLAAGDVADDGTQGGQLVTYTITVEYINFLTGQKVAQDYSAVVRPEAHDNLTVHPDCPTVVGYASFVCTVGGLVGAEAYNNGNGGVEAYRDASGTVYYGRPVSGLDIDLSDVKSNQTYRVYYFPNRVTYTVSHYVQNVVNDEYTLYYVEVLEGYVGTDTQARDLTQVDPSDPELGPVSLQNKGFIALVPFENAEIAVDGTTQIDSFYDRAYYLMTFKTEGGYGAEPIYARADTPIVPEDPQRQGYAFKGWFMLEMEAANFVNSNPRPEKDENGNYIPLYTIDGRVQFDAAGQERSLTVLDGRYYVTDTLGANQTVTGNTIEVFPMRSDELPRSMPSYHTAYIAIWEQAESSYTVMYWKEHPVDDGDGNVDNNYDFWCSAVITDGVQSGEEIRLADIQDPRMTGALADISETCYQWQQGTALQALDGKSVALVSLNGAQTVLHTESGNGLGRGTFNAAERAQEWTFARQGNGTYRLYYDADNGTRYYMVMNANGYMDLTTAARNATGFTVGVESASNVVTLYANGNYLNRYEGANGETFAGWNGLDDGSRFKLYQYTTTTYENPELNYYQYLTSDVDRYGIVKTVAGDGSTIVNVIYQPKTYHLRFFYARTTADGVHQARRNYVDKFSRYSGENAHRIDVLLDQIKNEVGSWEALRGVDHPEQLVDLSSAPANRVSKGQMVNEVDGCTYYYITFSAKYGENIMSLWPNAFLEYVETASGSAVFSGWAAEHFINYSIEHQSNVTIKALFTELDETLLYDSSYESYKLANQITDQMYYDKGTGDIQSGEDVYLDFVAYWESNPGQFLYYIWKEVFDYEQNPDGKYDNITFHQTLPKPAIVNGVQDYGIEPGDVFRYEGIYYQLSSVLNMCDWNGNNVVDQTQPVLVGYKFRESTLEGIPDQALTENAYTLFYKNPSSPQGYQSSYSLHYLYNANRWNITLHSHDAEKSMLNVGYGSYDGAQWALTFDKEYMMANYYPEALVEGAYEFEGWYKTSEHLPGTKADFTKPMPNKHMIMYANWVPKKFNVEIYQTSELNQLVHYGEWNEDGTHKAFQWLVTTGEDGQHIGDMEFGSYLPVTVAPAGPDITVGNLNPDTGKGTATIGENVSGMDADNGTGDVRANWIFICYAYMEDGVEHAIDVNSFTVAGDVKLYAKWTAIDIVNYEIRYELANLQTRYDGDKHEVVIEDPDGNRLDFYDGELCYVDRLDSDGSHLPWVPEARQVENGDGELVNQQIADPLVGRRNVGVNRTFLAKTGDQLYENYQQNYFPLHASHTVLMRYGENGEGMADNSQPLVATFYYIHLEQMLYTVRYLDSFGNAMVDVSGPDGTKDGVVDNQYDAAGRDMLTSNTVVTENYVFVDGYAPDAFQKTKVLSADAASNVITFHYSKADANQTPYTIIYYLQTLTDKGNAIVEDEKFYQEYTTVSGSIANLISGAELPVPYRNVTGYEYHKDVTTRYTAQNLEGMTYETMRRAIKTITIPIKDIPEGGLALRDLRGDEGKLVVEESTGTYSILCVDEVNKDLHGHTLDNSVFTYTYQDEGGSKTVELRDAQVHGGDLVLTVYEDQENEFSVEVGQYGTVVKVYYDLKCYPYFVYHKVSAEAGTGDSILAIEMGKAQFMSEVQGTAWSEEEMIAQGYPGYAVDSEDKSIVMTITIQDDRETPAINTMTFHYHERGMLYRYQTQVMIDPVTHQVRKMDDPNARLTVEQDPLDAVSGIADTAEPLLNSEAYRFAGWYLDPECTQAVENSGYSHYLVEGTEGLKPQKLEEFRYSGGSMTLTEENAFYAGPYDAATGRYAQEQTFYALFIPKMGALTIRRENMGPNADGHNEANSFVYTIRQTKGADGSVPADPIEMQVTIAPGQTQVTVINLPFGQYQITQEQNWSWRYQDSTHTITLHEENPYPEEVFDGSWTGKWLSGFAQNIANLFGN